MADRIIPLTCPACGSPSNEGLDEHAFGGEIKCKHCGVTSVLIIESQWHQKKAGEYVCSDCGRIAREGDRFCECSKSLLRSCVKCSSSFFVGKNVCPQCGWKQSNGLSNEATQVQLANMLQVLPPHQRFSAREFNMLCESISLCPLLTKEAEALLYEHISSTLQSRPGSLPLCHYNNHSASYSGWLFDQKNLSRVATWLQAWHSRWIVNLNNLQETLERKRESFESSNLDPDAAGNWATVIGVGVGIYAYRNGGTSSMISGAIGFGVAGFLIGLVLRGFYALHKNHLSSELSRLRLKIEQVKKEYPSVPALK